jgi:2-keto-4-pentenoate hydratase/2-oxohepta-3-ene-1,7-dioic acid hydratase in catechol pathway
VLPIERPQKIICVDLNYRDHAEESGMSPPERPILFAKMADRSDRARRGDRDPEDHDPGRLRGRTGVIIGSRGRGVSAEDA